MEKIDLYRSANLLIKRYGAAAAAEEADSRMKAHMVIGDAKAAAAWLGIGRAIDDLEKSSGTVN